MYWFICIKSSFGAPKSCSGSCPSIDLTSYSAVSSVQYAMLSSLLGPIRLVYDNTNAASQLLSRNQGPIEATQPLLCNFTAATGSVATIFSFNSTEFFRETTTVTTTTGSYAICTTLRRGSAYNALLNGQGTVCS
jgi:hypothetical protein